MTGSNGQDATPIVERARAYVLENFLYARTDVQLTDTDQLLERGIIDSMGVLELITFVQEEFSVQVSDSDVTEENFGTLNGIARYILSKRGAVPAS